VTGLAVGVLKGTCGGGAALSAKCNLACDKGYAAGSSSKPGECKGTAPGKAAFIGQSITCTAAKCAAVTSVPANALVGTCVAGGALDAKCAFQCKPDFYPESAPVQGTCTGKADGTASWEGQTISCKECYTKPGKNSCNAHASCADVECSDGNPKTHSGACLEGGTECVSKACSAIANGAWTFCPNDKCETAACNPGYSGSTNGKCDVAAKCGKITSVPANAEVGTCDANGALSGKCDLGCKAGFYPESSVQGTCTVKADGSAAWEGQSITCKACFTTAGEKSCNAHASCAGVTCNDGKATTHSGKCKKGSTECSSMACGALANGKCTSCPKGVCDAATCSAGFSGKTCEVEARCDALADPADTTTGAVVRGASLARARASSSARMGS
jgi:hypothetical protein